MVKETQHPKNPFNSILVSIKEEQEEELAGGVEEEKVEAPDKESDSDEETNNTPVSPVFSLSTPKR